MLFRDFKTGLGIGLTALLLSSGAGAGTIGGAPGMDDPDTPQDERLRVSDLRATTIATEIFGGTARANSRLRLTHQDDVFLMLGRATRFPIAIDVEISGAAFRDVELTATAKQYGLKALYGPDDTNTPADADSDPDLLAEPVPLYDVNGNALTMGQLFDSDDMRILAANNNVPTGATEIVNFYNNLGVEYTGATAVVIDTVDQIEPGLIFLATTANTAPQGATSTALDNGNCAATFPRNDTTIRFRECGVDSGTAVRAFHIEGISLDSAQGLATPGNSVMIWATVTDAEDSEDVIDTADPEVLYRSANTVSTSVRSGGRIGIDPFADPPFSQIVNRGDAPSNSANIGTVTATVSSTRDGAGNPVMAASLAESADVTVSHGVFSDDAFVRVQLGSLRAPSRSYAIEGDSVTYDEIDIDTFAGEPPATGMMGPRPGVSSEVSHPVMVVFNGRDAISTWEAGDAAVSYTDDNAEDDMLAPHGASGTLASFSRGGLRTELNMAQAAAGDGATRYQSWVRIHNNGVTGGEVTIYVMDAETGDMLGSWDSGNIPAGAAIQVSAAALEDHLGHTPASGDQYNLIVEGGINGYVQHVMWNAVDGLFSDLSGFRAGGGLNTAP